MTDTSFGSMATAAGVAAPNVISPLANAVLANQQQQAPTDNLSAATSALNLTPQEQALYQMHLSNLYGPGGVDNDGSNPNLPAGSRSTLYQSPQENNGKFYNIPTVWNGKVETEPYTKSDGTVMDVPNKTALANVAKMGWEKFPAYSTPDEADARYDQMHAYMDKDTARYLQGKRQ